MALKKPSDLFGKNNEENNNTNTPVVETDNSLREELTKVESLSEQLSQLSQLQQELTQKVVQTDLEKLVLSQINTMQENFAVLQEEFQQSNERDISKFRETVVQLGDVVGNLVENEIPKYKKQITSTDIRIGEKFNEFKEVVEENIADIREDVETKVENIASAIDDNLEYFNQQLQETSSGVKKTVDTYNKLSKIVESRIEKENGQLEEYSKIIQSLHDVKADVVIAEQHIKNVDKYLKENHQELIELKEEVFAEIEKLPLGDVQENVRKLERKLEYIEEVYKNIEPEVIVKEVIQEGLLNEPPDTKNSDPLTPLDQNFVTLDQLQQHYRLFINRIQQQLATIGGGGETRLEFLDDVDRDSVKQDGYVLQYDATVGKFIGTSYVPGGSGAGGTSYWVGTNAGIYTTGNVAIGTDVVGSGSTALWVEGDARITGILSVGQGTVTIDGITNTVNVDNLIVGTTLTGPSGVGYATVGYVTQQITNLVDGAPGALDTLNELAAALNDDENFATTVTNSLALKANIDNASFTGITTTQTLNVGVGGTIITTTGIGSVGIGSTQPDATLVVNAPSGYTGNILDIQIGGSSRFSVQDQTFSYAPTPGAKSKFHFGSFTSNTGWVGVNYISHTGPVAYLTTLSNTTGVAGVNNTGYVAWLSTSHFTSYNNWDLRLYRDDAGILAQRNGTNAQTSRIYNTYTSATNFERAQVGWSTDVFIVGTEKGVDGGTARQLELQTDGTTRVAITTTGLVGIGSTQPIATLDVNGDVNITGIVTATSYTGSGVNLSGIVTSIVAGTNITISGSSGEVTINSSGGGGETISPFLLMGA